MTAKQAEKEARIVAAEFEWQIETGFIADDRQTFGPSVKSCVSDIRQSQV